MDKDIYHQFLRRYQVVNQLAESEVKKLSFMEKFKHLSSLLLFASGIGIDFRSRKHSLGNWTLLKTKL